MNPIDEIAHVIQISVAPRDETGCGDQEKTERKIKSNEEESS